MVKIITTEESSTMPITELNHFLLVAKDLDRTKDFYCRVLGMEVDTQRPDFGFPGYWLKANGETCVHLAWQAPNEIRDKFLDLMRDGYRRYKQVPPFDRVTPVIRV